MYILAISAFVKNIETLENTILLILICFVSRY